MGLPSAVRRYLTATARKGGQARAEQLSARRRRAIARKAARARWARMKPKRKA